jgi:hypothetical protein
MSDQKPEIICDEVCSLSGEPGSTRVAMLAALEEGGGGGHVELALHLFGACGRRCSWRLKMGRTSAVVADGPVGLRCAGNTGEKPQLPRRDEDTKEGGGVYVGSLDWLFQGGGYRNFRRDVCPKNSLRRHIPPCFYHFTSARASMGCLAWSWFDEFFCLHRQWFLGTMIFKHRVLIPLSPAFSTRPGL